MRILISWIKLHVVFCPTCVFYLAQTTVEGRGEFIPLHKNQINGAIATFIFTSDVGIQRRIELDGDWWGMMKKYCNDKQKLIQRKL